jgi:hypothetical protein
MNIKEIKVGAPYLWQSSIYGAVAVHVASLHNGVAMVTVDGGEAAKQVIAHPELIDGWPVLADRLHKRPAKARKAAPGKVEVPAEVINTIREVPGVGKVALVETGPIAGTRVSTPHTDAIIRAATTAQRNKRRMSLAQALTEARKMADRNPTHFKWASQEITF